jgi:hypothetical protein
MRRDAMRVASQTGRDPRQALFQIFVGCVIEMQRGALNFF